VTLTPPSSVGISPEAKEGAVLQIVPLAGVLAGTRSVPLITIKVFWAITGPALAVVTDVIAALVLLAPRTANGVVETGNADPFR